MDNDYWFQTMSLRRKLLLLASILLRGDLHQTHTNPTDAAIKKYDVNGLISCAFAWTASSVYFEKRIVEDTWYVLGPTCALEIDLTLRDLFAREQNEYIMMCKASLCGIVIEM